MIGWALRQLLQWTIVRAVAVAAYTHKDEIAARMRAGDGITGPASAPDDSGAVSRTVRIRAKRTATTSSTPRSTGRRCASWSIPVPR